MNMIEQLNAAARAIAKIRSTLAQIATAPVEDLIEKADAAMDEVDQGLREILSVIGQEGQRLWGDDDLRDLVLAGDTVAVTFYGRLGAGTVFLRADAESPVALEDHTGTRELTRLWRQIDEAEQPVAG